MRCINIYNNMIKGKVIDHKIIFLKVLMALILMIHNSYFILLPTSWAQAVPPSSGNYKLMDYGFGSGGVATSSSSNYSLFGTLGQVDQGSPSSANYFIGAGLEYTIQSSVSAAPTFVNPSNWYNKLRLTINPGGQNPTDYTYAIRIASESGNFKYVQNDNTVGESLGNEDWQSYTLWGSSSGFTIIGLDPDTTYTAQVSSRQGQFFTQFMWSPAATATTDVSSLSFDIDIASSDSETAAPYTLNIGSLSPGSVITAPEKAWVDFSTNANSGGFLSISGTNTGLQSPTASHTITSTTADLTAQPSGYGARSSSVSQSSGGPMQALSPYNGVSNNVGILTTTKNYIYDSNSSPVVGGRVSFELKAKASTTTPSANDYADVLTILATGSF